MGSRFSAGRSTALVVAVMTVLAVLPAGASPEDRATALQAMADDGGGRVVDINNGGSWFEYQPGLRADVTMPPQREAVEEVRDGGRMEILGDASVEHGAQYYRADGNVAAGTADALATQRDLAVEIAALGMTITAESIRSVSRTDCEGGATPASASAGTAIVGLRVNGEPVEAVNEPNGPGERFDAPEGRGYLEIRTMQVQPDPDANGWTTTALLIRGRSLVPSPLTSPDEIPLTHELRLGITSTTVECAF